MKTTACLSLLLLVIAACEAAPDGAGPVERRSSALLVWDPFGVRPPFAFDLIGRGLNGRDMNGKVLDGHAVVSVSLDGVRLAKGPPRSLKLDATVFRGAGGGPLGSGIVGATFTGIMDDGEEIELRVDSVEVAGEWPRVFLAYVVSYPVEGGREPLCGFDESGAPVAAIPLAGVWDLRQGVPGGGSWTASKSHFTFACDGFVLAKCVRMGYAPWERGRICEAGGGGASCVKTTLAAHHQACTRALRADYCGDGVSHTTDGTWVEIHDGIGIRADGEDWLTEGEWTADGARCVVPGRVRSETTPACLASLESDGCGDPAHFETGTLLVSEVEPDAGG